MKSASASRDAQRLLSMGTAQHAVQALAAAVQTGICDHLAGAACTQAALARRSRLSRSALARFLGLLEALGMVRKKGVLYQNTALAGKYLCRSSKTYLGGFLVHAETMIEPWQQLPCALQRGRMQDPSKKRAAAYPRQLTRFLQAMDDLGRIKSELIREEINIGGCRRMLDLGGGLGTYSVSFARGNRKLRSVVYDLQDVARHARAYVRQAGLQDRVSVMAGECLTEGLPAGPFDLVLISNLLHIYGPRECQRIVCAASRVLAPRGTMLIHDYVAGRGDRLAVALFDISMLVGTPRGRCHACADIRAWLKSAGMWRLRQAGVLAGTSLVWGQKKP